MKNITKKMVIEAENEFETFCAKNGSFGLKQVHLENKMLELRKGWRTRVNAVEFIVEKNNLFIYVFSDKFLSYAAYNTMYYNALETIAEVAAALEDDNKEELDEALTKAKKNDRINLKRVLEVFGK